MRSLVVETSPRAVSGGRIVTVAAGALVTAILAVAVPAMAATASADLSVQLTAAPDPVLTLRNLTYTATVTNFGPNGATGTEVGVAVHEGLAFVSATVSQGTCVTPPAGGQGVVVCTIGRLGHLSTNNTATVTVVAKVIAFQGVVRGVARVRSAVPDPNTTNNAVRTRVDVQPRTADLSIQMSAPELAAVGGLVTYTLSASNAGPNAALRTVIYDRLPKGTTFVSAATTRGTCRTPVVGGTGTVRCGFGSFGHLSTNNEATVTIVVKVVATRGTLTNVVAITSDSVDPDKSNNRVAAATSITSAIIITPTTADLSIQVTAPDSVPITGEQFRYVIAVGNGGPEQAQGVGLSDRIPDGTTFVSATPSQGQCSTPAAGHTGTVECSLGNIDYTKGATVTLVVSVTAAAGTQISNTATVIHDLLQEDPTPLDEIETLNLSVGVHTIQIEIVQVPTASVSIADTASNISTVDVDQLLHTITVKNEGPSAADDVQFSVQFAGGIAVAMAALTATQGGCSEDFTSVTHHFVNCDVGALAAGATATFTLPTEVSEADLKANPINLSWDDLGAQLAPELTTQQVEALPNPVATAMSVARITSLGGNVWDINEGDNTAMVLFDPNPLTFTVTLADHSTCHNQDFGKFGALLQIDCDSPVSQVTTWATSLASVATAGIGNGVLAAIAYYSIEVVAIAAENVLVFR